MNSFDTTANSALASMSFTILSVLALVALLVFFVLFLASRYKRCPSDKILVVFGRIGNEQASRCIHGGGVLVWPLIQDYAYLSLTPMTMNIPLRNALSLQNIRIHVPSTFTVGISTDPVIMNNAAERLLGLNSTTIEEMAQEIIFGQLRLTVASLTIEQINQDREKFLDSIRRNVEPELNKIGLNLINVNITDISDESAYIDSIGKKAASEAINRALIDVAEQEKLGAIGQAQANKEREIRVAENNAESVKGRKRAEADQRVFVQQQETEAAVGEAVAHKNKEVGVAENDAESVKGKKAAEANQRVYVQQQEAEAVTGENEAKAKIAVVSADLEEKEATARQRAQVAQRKAEAEIQKAQYQAELERLKAAEVVEKQVEKEKIEIEAEANAARQRIEAKGAAEATLLKYDAEAKGVQQVLEGKSKGYEALVESCNGDARAASTLLMIEKIEEIVSLQVEAIKNLKIDKITVWDSGAGEGGAGGKGSSTANFLSSMVKSLPPLQDISKMAGVELPDYLGQVKPDAVQDEDSTAEENPKAPATKENAPQPS